MRLFLTLSARSRSLSLVLFSLVAVLIVPRLDARDFVRGRANDDNMVDLSDAVTILNFLFIGGDAPLCLKAADVDDNGSLQITDPIYLLNNLFLGGPAPPSPFPDLGPDLTPDSLTCGEPGPLTISVLPAAVQLDGVGAIAQLTVTGTDGSETFDLTEGSTGTKYACDAAGIAFAYRDGKVEAKGAGSATIVVRNGEATAQAQVVVGTAGGASGYRVVATNDLGMHCIDREFSIYSILPPFNVVRAQVVRGLAGGLPVLLGDAAVDVRYSPVVDASGSINSTSIGKTGFWDHVAALYGLQREPGQGLLGLYMPDDAPDAGPQPMAYEPAQDFFAAAGIPAIDRDDAGQTGTYPLIRVSAYAKGTGQFLASTDVVVPVSSETDCQNCHSTGAIAAKSPAVTWATDADKEIETKKNVLLLHDHKNGTDLSTRTPILCASCHYSPALDLAGAGPQGEQLQHDFFSKAMHDYHGSRDGEDGNPLFPADGDAASTCYQCHPGTITRCLRGAMANAGMQCKDCHGGMRAVGGAFPLAAGGSIDGQNDGNSRRPWKDLPRCQSCHTGDALNHISGQDYVLSAGGIRLVQAFKTGDQSASPILATNKRFAENANTLYRFSTGHGGVLCENCHGSTHAEWPHADPAANDNVAAVAAQGHTGKLSECGVSHAPGSLSLTTNGPHNMHNVNDPRWTDHEHEEFFERNPTLCKACHGADLLGTVLSRTAVARSYQVEEGTVNVAKGTKIRCNLCHEMPGADG